MSLINDALKRASQAQPPPPPIAEATPPLRPAEHKRQPGSLLILFPVVVLFILAIATWFVFKGWQSSQDAEGRVAVAAREATPVNSLSNEPKAVLITDQITQQNKIKQATSQGEISSASANKASDTGTVSSPTNADLAVIGPTQPVVPAFKLQGIFYRPNKPSVIINSKTLFVGDKVANAKVLAIRRETVTLECDGQTKVLTLE